MIKWEITLEWHGLNYGMCFLSSQGLFVGAAWRVCLPQVTAELLIFMSVTLQTNRPIDCVFSLGLWGQEQLPL